MYVLFVDQALSSQRVPVGPKARGALGPNASPPSARSSLYFAFRRLRPVTDHKSIRSLAGHALCGLNDGPSMTLPLFDATCG